MVVVVSIAQPPDHVFSPLVIFLSVYVSGWVCVCRKGRLINSIPLTVNSWESFPHEPNAKLWRCASKEEEEEEDVLSLMANPKITGHALQVERRKDDAMTGLGSLGTSMGLHSSEFCGIPCCWPWHPSLCVVGYLKVPASSTSTYLSSFIYVFPCNHISSSSRRTRIYKTRTKLNPIDDDDGRASW